MAGQRPSWEDVWSQLRLYGTVFDREAEAERAVTDLEARLADLEDRAGEQEPRTAAVLYPSVGGGPTYAYGTGSMAHAQLGSAGLENVFADADERVFEVGVEELLGRDPDVLVLLHSDGEPDDVVRTVRGLPGAEQLTAVREDAVQTLLFNFTEPASPLVLDGLERILDGLPR